MRICLLPLFVILLGANGAKAAEDQKPPAAANPKPFVSGETKEHKDARMAWWRDARFGMFIHWGLYCVPAGRYHGKAVDGPGEWLMRFRDIPLAEYAAYAPQFNPVKFDAAEWVRIAKDAGMKYIVLTSKHHEGFAMFHSKVDGYNLYDASPFKRDPVAELAAACKAQGMRFGLYYSQNLDWYHPGGGIRRASWDPAQKGDPDAYVDDLVIPQLKEILTNYGEISILWWDAYREGITSRERSARMYQTVMALNPNLITNNRLGAGYEGDTHSYEQGIPSRTNPKDWETCMTINDTWGFKTDDTNYKTTPTLLRNLVDVASKGGNFLLNVGPTAEGIIPAEQVQRIREVGAWLAVNGEAVYGTRLSPFGDEWGAFSETEKNDKGKPVFKPAWDWRCTTKPGKLFIHLLTWPKGVFVLDAKGQLKTPITKAYLLTDPQRQPLAVTRDGERWSVALPAQAPDPVASVLVLELQPEVR